MIGKQQYITDDNSITSSLAYTKAEIDDLASSYATSAKLNIGTASTSLQTGELAYDPNTGSLYVGTSSGTNSYIGTYGGYNTSTTYTPNYYTTTANWSQYLDKRAEYFQSIFEFLNEEEIMNLMDTLISRCMTIDEIKGIFKSISNRTFSEDFLMHFIDYFEMDILKTVYSAKIKSQEYPRLALLVQADSLH